MEEFSVQLIVLFILLIGNVLFGMLPIICIKIFGRMCGCEHQAGNKAKAVTFLVYFGGGVLISTCFLSLLPKSREDFDRSEHSFTEEKDIYSKDIFLNSTSIESAHEHKHEEHFPLPEFLVLCGFFAAYVVMEVLQQFRIPFSRRVMEKLNDEMLHKRFCSCAKRNMECSKTFKDPKTEQTLFGLEQKQLEPGNAVIVAQVSGIHRSVDPTSAGKGDLLRSSIIAQPIPNYGSITTAAGQVIENQATLMQPTVVVANDGSIAVMKPTLPVLTENKFPKDNCVSVFFLSYQAVMQGISAGVKVSTSSWLPLLMICVQQFLITFVLGCEILGGTEKVHHILFFVIVLSIMSPAGVLTTMLTSASLECVPFNVVGILDAVTCGALLYFIFYEVLRYNRLDGVQHFAKFCAITAGASLMAVLEYISGHV